MENFPPFLSEIKRLQTKINRALKNQNIFYANECMDKLSAMTLDISLDYARYISRLEDTLGRVRRKESKDELIGLILAARKDYSDITKSLRRFQEHQQTYGLTNAPKE